MTGPRERSPIPLPALAVLLLIPLATGAVPVRDGARDGAQEGSREDAPAPPPCQAAPEFSYLDFWLGDWEVYSDGRLVGTNRIEKALSGCAVFEHWRDRNGGEGKSLFYYDPGKDEWKQIWITGDTTRPGGLKEKRLVERLPDGGTRFQGEIRHPERGTYLDRTTLTPLPGDRVRQVIELSTDGGETWRAGFDALYVRPGSGPPEAPRADEAPG